MPVRTAAKKPASLSFEQAAALPLTGLIALQAIRRSGLRQGQSVLVHVAAGGVGSFAVQLATHAGARVVGTASAVNHDYVRSLAPGGRIVSITDARARTELGGDYVWVRPDAADLAELARLVDAGVLKVEIAQVFDLDHAADAMRAVESGHVRGKVVVRV